MHKANKNIDVDTISKAVTNIQLPNGKISIFSQSHSMIRLNELSLNLGKAVKMDINIEELRQMQEKHNLIGKLVATALGLGDKVGQILNLIMNKNLNFILLQFKGSKSPLRGDNMISSADLHKEFEKLSEKLGGGNGLKRPVGNLTQGTSQISELFRPKRSNPVEDNNWGSKRTIKYNYAKTFGETLPSGYTINWMISNFI